MLELLHADKVTEQGARSSVVNGPFTGTKERRSFKPKVASSILVGRMEESAGKCRHSRRLSASRPDPSADLFCKLDDGSLGAADVAEAVAVFIAHQLADQLGAACL